MAPALPPKVRQIKGMALVLKVFKAMVPLVLLIFTILDSIFFGLIELFHYSLKPA